MVPGALWISPSRPATSTSGAADLGGASSMRPAAALASGEGDHWHVRGRKWHVLFSGQDCQVLCVSTTWKSVGYPSFISVSGAVLVIGGSR